MPDATHDPTPVPRRQALSILAGGVAAAGISAALLATGSGGSAGPGEGPPGGPEGAAKSPDQATTRKAGTRLPVAYLPHGGGPWPFVDMGLPRGELDELRTYLERVASLPASRPKALLVVSAHWEERVPTLMTHPKPPMFFDYYGFPEKSYTLSWPAPGAPTLVPRVRELLASANIASAEDTTRGFDHGTFVPLMLTYPLADIPTTQLSLKVGLDPKEHLAIGRALAPLRDEGVFILGSGMSYHDLRGFRGGRGASVAETFDAWLREVTTAEPKTRDGKLAAWQTAPSARAAHPREEHLLPLMVIAGAAGDDRGVLDYNGTFMGLRLSGYHFG